MIKILLIDLGDLRNELNEPLGIECISSRVIRELDAKVDIYWYSMLKPLCFQELLQYDFIGISMNIGTLNRFEEIYSYMRNNNSHLPLILGGCVPTFAYKQLIEKYYNIICIYGEGEEAFYELINTYQNEFFRIDERLLGIGNLAFKMKGEIFITSQRSIDLEQVDTVVRDSNVLEYIKENHGIIRVEGSRGCSWNKCSFCCVNAKYADPSWRGFSLDKIINELIEISELGFRAPYFTDEDFFGQNYTRAIELGKRIIALKEQGRIRKDMNFFVAILAADAVCEPGQKALTVLRQAGLREVFLGIESFEEEQLQRYHKKANIDTNRRAIEFISEIDLYIDAGYILFDPEMSFKALGSNINYIKSLKLNEFDSRSLKRLRLQPLTAISESLSKTIVGALDVDNLEYPYKFMDEKVGEVYRRYKIWEDKSLDSVWEIQSASRGEISEELRKELKSILSQIRNIDFEVLYNIYTSVKNNMISGTSSESLEIYTTQKDQLIQSFTHVMKEYHNS